MKTVPLYGKKAAGRVALVDDADYDLVMQYRWHIHDPEPKPGRRRKPPYAVTNSYSGGMRASIRMHCLIMGAKGIDHEDHDGLNNQRYNLRIATAGQNARNVRPRQQESKSSRYKGVCRVRRGLWRAYVDVDGKRRTLGEFASELEAAYAHDAAARELHGEFACPNFPEGPTAAMLEQWRAEREARNALIAAGAEERDRAFRQGLKDWWTGREYKTYTCVECGAEFQSRHVTQALRCSKECRAKAAVRQRRARRAERRARGEKVT